MHKLHIVTSVTACLLACPSSRRAHGYRGSPDQRAPPDIPIAISIAISIALNIGGPVPSDEQERQENRKHCSRTITKLRYTPRVASTKKGSKPKAAKKTPPASLYSNDRWTLDLAELGYDRDAEQLARMLLLCEPPFVTALEGSGGAGKTSVMRYAMTLLGGGPTRVHVPERGAVLSDDAAGGDDMAQAIYERGRELLKQHGATGLGAHSDANPLSDRARNRIATAWFNPWRSRDEPNPIVPLLRGLAEQLTIWGRTTSWATAHARAHFEAGLHLIGQLADSATAGSARSSDTYPPTVSALDSGAMRVAGALDRSQVGQLVHASDTERFRLLFEHAIESVLGVVDAKSKRKGKPVVEFASAEQHRLIIFVDDVDRCSGATVERLLEAIELYLRSRHTVFVFAADLQAMRGSLAAHWRGSAPAVIDDYLERSFQSRVRLADSVHYPLFIHNRLAEWKLVSAPPIAAAEYRDPAAPHPLAQLIADVLPANPRRVKSFLNGLRLAWEMARARIDDLHADELPAFALIHRLRISAPRVFELLGRDTDYHLRALQDFFEHCKSRTPYRPDPAHAAACALMVDAFRPMVNLDRDWRDAAVPVREPGPVAVAQLLADQLFARRWRDTGVSAQAVRRYAGAPRRP